MFFLCAFLAVQLILASPYLIGLAGAASLQILV